MINKLLSVIPWSVGGIISIEQNDPLYVLITAIITALFQYWSMKRKEKKENK